MNTHQSASVSSTWGECHFTFKLLLQGLSGTGKSQLASRYLHGDDFSRDTPYRQTRKADFGYRFVRYLNKSLQI